MKIYTFTGDDGTTSLSNDKRVPKHCLRIEACGSLDELISWIGLIRSYKENSVRKEVLVYIQDQLMRAVSTLATDNDKPEPGILPEPACLKTLEAEIDSMEAKLPPISSFILPGGNIVISDCHITRCVCRRAERSVLRLNETEPVPGIIYKFLNRLSDYLFVLSRTLSLELDNEDIKWSL